MPQQQRSEATRSHLLQAALACFARSGYDATGVAEICAQAGVSKGAFYHHFPSKQALFLELLDDWLSSLDQRFEAVQVEAASVPQVLNGMAQAAREAFIDARGQMPLFLEFYRQATHDPLLHERTIAPFLRYQNTFASLIRRGIAEGSLRPVEPVSAARTLLALAVGLLVQAALQPSDDPVLAQESIQHLLKGLEKP